MLSKRRSIILATRLVGFSRGRQAHPYHWSRNFSAFDEYFWDQNQRQCSLSAQVLDAGGSGCEGSRLGKVCGVLAAAF